MGLLDDYISNNQELLIQEFSVDEFAQQLTEAIETAQSAVREQRATPTRENTIKSVAASHPLYAFLHGVFGKPEAQLAGTAFGGDLKQHFRCPFCVRTYTQRDVVAGPNVVICRDCVQMALDTLSPG